MKYERIRKAILEQVNKRHGESKPIETQEDLNEVMQRNGKQYKGDFETQKKKLLKYITLQRDKDLSEELHKISLVEEHEGGLPNPLVLTIEWKRSRMWGKNPRVSTNYGFEGDSIGGCGYCKLSTATAEGLNSHLAILKGLFAKEEERLRELEKSKMSKEDQEKYLNRRTFIGYGSGYYALPRFEGGVGVSSHETICESIGLNMKCITSTSNTDVYMISKQ